MNAVTMIRLLKEARARTLLLAADLHGERLLGPKLRIVNPPLWEIGHVGWFQERWCLRHTGDGGLLPSMLPDADALYDSAVVPHASRWDLPLPAFDSTLRYLGEVLEAVLARIEREGATEHMAYFAQLAAFHEEMHCEAFTYTRQTLQYPGLATSLREKQSGKVPCAGDSEVSGGCVALGATAKDGFVFDNEKWAHEVNVDGFSIARAPVTNAQFMAFVEDRGYQRRESWGDEGWRWRSACDAQCPVYWRKEGGGWLARRFDRWEEIEPDHPVMHVNWFEADAYCRWAGRRLPAEAEWELAAATAPGALHSKRRYPWGDDASSILERANLYGAAGECVDVGAFADGDSAWGCRQMLGNVWEWTADWFQPYPGFMPDPYREYSAPWFGDHKVLRGGCFATRPALLRNTWRNFYTPDRRDVFAGFRTCAAR